MDASERRSGVIADVSQHDARSDGVSRVPGGAAGGLAGARQRRHELELEQRGVLAHGGQALRGRLDVSQQQGIHDDRGTNLRR